MSLNFSPSCPNKVDCSSKKDTIIEASNWEAKKPVHGIMVAMTICYIQSMVLLCNFIPNWLENSYNQ